MALDKIPASQISGSSIIGVTANSASTINANSVNFLNTQSISVTVEQGASGIANVSFNAKLSLGMIIALSGD
jgi:hypothetical protein